MVQSLRIDDPLVLPGSAADPLAWFVHWLDRERTTVLPAVVTVVMRAVPELAVARDDPRERIRESISPHLQAITDCVRDASSSVRRISMPAVIEKYTRALARHDALPLPILLRSFEIVHAELWRLLVRALRKGPYRLAPADRSAVLEHTSVHMFEYFQAASCQTATAYTAERALLERRAASRRTEVVSGVLAGSIDQATAEQALGYEFNSVHVGYVGWVERMSDLDRLDSIVATFTEHIRPRQHLTVPVGDRAVHGWFAIHSEHWRRIARDKELPSGINLAWGAPHEGFGGFLATHADALEARRVGESLGAHPSVLFEDVAVSSLASRDLAAASAFVSRELGRLYSDDVSRAGLLDTLRVYLEELASPTKTARRLYVHPNTVVKRLERIEALLGRPVDPASLALRLALELAPLVNKAS